MKPYQELPDYRVGPICAHPACSRLTDHVHHIWRRSFLGGPYAWVELEDGTKVGNLLPLCWFHHQLVTENKAQILWDGNRFHWSEGVVYTPLSWQPPVSRVTSNEDPEPRSTASCPTCQRPFPREKDPDEPARPRKTWTITVPADKIEDGADVLDTLLDSARIGMEERGLVYGAERKARYYVLSTALGLFVQHMEETLGDQ